MQQRWNAYILSLADAELLTFFRTTSTMLTAIGSARILQCPQSRGFPTGATRLAFWNRCPLPTPGLEVLDIIATGAWSSVGIFTKGLSLSRRTIDPGID